MAYANLITLFQSIADKIRSKTGKSNAIVANDFPESVDEVFEAGKKSEYDAFWDAYQDNGNRTNYSNGFSGIGWNSETFVPKYDIYTWSAYMLFRESGNIDMEETLVKRGKSITVTGEDFAYMFSLSRIAVIDGIIFTSNGGCNLNNTFTGMPNLKEIRCEIPYTNSINSGDVFREAIHLTHIRFKGPINVNLNLQWSPLDVTTLKHIISLLTNFSGTANEYKYNVVFNEACWTALEADSVSPNGGTWKDYVGDLGWNAV
jgi:hypothetical protein